MDKPRLAWAITGSGHYIEECLDFLLTQDNVDLYLSLAGEEVLLMYGISLDDIRKKMPVYRDKTASAPPVGHFYKGYYHTFVMAPTTSNTVAKCVLGIADSLVTNLYSQAGKCKVPSIVYPLRHSAGNGNHCAGRKSHGLSAQNRPGRHRQITRFRIHHRR